MKKKYLINLKSFLGIILIKKNHLNYIIIYCGYLTPQKQKPIISFTQWYKKTKEKQFQRNPSISPLLAIGNKDYLLNSHCYL
jgi:hypothetical protein